MQVDVSFRDRRFGGIGYEYNCEMESIPRIGERVWLPNGRVLKTIPKAGSYAAEVASVADVVWVLPTPNSDEPEFRIAQVHVICDMEWEETE